jgi:hypothetical protein
VDTDESGNAKVYYDCVKVANAGLSAAVQNGLNGSLVNAVSGSWHEVSN